MTGDHLAEWESGGDEEQAKSLRKQHALLRIVHQLSINAKHFKPRDRAMSPVAGTHDAQFFNWPEGKARRQETLCNSECYLELSTDEAEELGREFISSLDLGHRLVQFWRERLRLP